MSGLDHLYATCASGLEQLLADELGDCGATSVSVAGAGVRFEGGLEPAYRACLWSRVANRVLLPIHSGKADSPEALYSVVQEIDWAHHLPVTGTLAVDFYCSHSNITHSQYGALKVKDAVVDQFREKTGVRPNVERDQPDVRINVYLYRNKARVAIDLSGNSLHRRGYREQAGPAPIKENLAAALLLQAGWPSKVEQRQPFLDPMCGSGTIAIEAAMIACKQAPGLYRDYFGFLGWQQHDAKLWQNIVEQAEAMRQPCDCVILASDNNQRAIELAQQNAHLAHVADAIEFVQHDVLSGSVIEQYSVDSNKRARIEKETNGLLLTNPPYGERLAADESFYKALGMQFSEHYAGWQLALITASAGLLKQSRLPIKPSLSVRNGGMDCQVFEGRIPALRNAITEEQRTIASDERPTDELAQMQHGASVWDLAEQKKSVSLAKIDVTEFANRVKKNNKKLKNWLKREQVQAWRAYDADLPEFAVAIDVYECASRHVVVQEYQAPTTVNSMVAEARLRAVLNAIPELYSVSESHVHLKVRQKQAGLSQYEKQSSKGISDVLTEQGCQFELNFTDYLDTGIFLDHRKVRRHILAAASGKRFLNLFAYTGAATIASIVGGAASSVSVDLSNKYCQWMERNIRRNAPKAVNHSVIKADVMHWLEQNKDARFDIILLDPPTFSNSTGVDADWNVQRDHKACIEATMQLLEKDGLLIFSNNYRRFKIDSALSVKNGGRYIIEDKSRWSIDTDFQRNARIHQCWFIKHA